MMTEMTEQDLRVQKNAILKPPTIQQPNPPLMEGQKQDKKPRICKVFSLTPPRSGNLMAQLWLVIFILLARK